MSQGGVFKLVLRDERFDRWFTASDVLRRRLDAVRVRREAAGLPNVQPTFADLEASHLVYVRAAYRPHVAIASEYARVRASGDGVAALGAAGGTAGFTFPAFGHFTSDLALHVRFPAIGSAAALAAGELATASVPLLRYCAYPGLRLLRRVAFRSTELPIDEYDADDAAFYSKLFVPADQRPGWERCHGQQEERHATFMANGFTGSLVYRDGPQTPRFYQPAFDMFIPLQLWLCRDASQALLNDLIPNSQRTLTCEFAALDDIVSAWAPDPLAPGELARVPLPFARLPLELSLYVDGLYTNPEVHDIFASRLGFSLIRVHQRVRVPLQNTSDRILLNQMKFPLEYMAVGLRDRRNAADPDQWLLMGTPAVRTDATRLVVPAIVWNAGLAVNQLVVREARDTSTLESFTAALWLTAHGIDLYPRDMPATFYNAYLPNRYAVSSLVVAPMDASAFFVTLCLYPGKHNPSGQLNLSTARECYINYAMNPASPFVADYKPGDAEMVISASSLNFLIRKGDSVALRFSC